ncbi:MAG TPA: cyclopropane-fatty-acyl-phospholipid synthase family protein [Vicinamibacterales bacterium]|nr:cyclopropane-fatty-acyl-phospholipid synthase family protein [Vicinamibacterales bacterium]
MATRSAAPSADHAQEQSRHGLDRALASALQSAIAGAGVGVELWNGVRTVPPGTERGALVVRDRRALLGLVLDPDLQFGECYSDGRLDISGDFGGVIDALSLNARGHRLSLRERWALVTERAGGLRAARRNIHRHYDIGNAFYQLWLDSELVYTCAYYPSPAATLEEAQTAKLDLVCRKVRLQRGDFVIDAGCGWGALALHMAKRYGARVRAFNISREQIEFASARAAREGVSDRVEFVEDDYRNITGRCDVFVSVGMLEHVGLRNYAALSRVIKRTLDGRTGRGLLHFIGRERRRPVNAWTRRRIFPGGYVPTLAQVDARVLEPAGFATLDVENLRLHYARTLTDWWERYERAVPEVRRMFDERFVRMWRLYLAGSRAAFLSGWLQLFQIVFAPPGLAVRWTRDDLYRATPATDPDPA